uniref:DUF5615 domain-containing protein n=1 Tax=Candidatus Kentrum sp. DK TaxID=2126562 RepID=A0A450TI70_9GAMM|nr:MAG: hypothetical protein BECKDK2373B_GA0170837_11814 [Candidatus Kentron sp. DK]
MPPRKVLLDECMPREFARYITGHEVRTVQAVGWKSIKNGDLLRLVLRLPLLAGLFHLLSLAKIGAGEQQSPAHSDTNRSV